MKFSIVVGYRNRDISRVRRSLDALANQSFYDFELIFVDYGSDTFYQIEVKKLVAQYRFVQYVYSHTKGWFWNRAHALNTGVRFAIGSILLFYDIDLLPEKLFLEKLNRLSFDNTFYTFSCFYLPEHFNYEKNFIEKDGVHFEQNYVGLCAASSEVVHAVCGFDEYFMVWGAEDDDFYERLKKSNLNHIHQSISDFVLFHQWHPSHAPEKPNIWYLQMVHYMSQKRYLPAKALSLWGKQITIKERLTLSQGNKIQFDADLKVSSETGYLLFNELIDAIYNPALLTIRFEYRELQKFDEELNLFSLFKPLNKKRYASQISLSDVLQVIQHLIGCCAQNLTDYKLLQKSNSLQLILIK